MNNYKLLLKIFRYLIQACILYILLRYFPYIELPTHYAVSITILLLLITVVIEMICTLYMSKENYQTCDTCESFNDKSDNQTCRLVKVCDNKSENFIDVDKLAKIDIKLPQIDIKPPEIDIKQTINLDKDLVVNADKIQPVSEKKQEPLLKTHNIPDSDDYPVSDNFVWKNKCGYVGYDDRQGYGSMFYDQYPYYNKYHHSEKDDSIKNTRANLGGKDTHPEADDGITNYNLLQQRIEQNAHDIGPYESSYQNVAPKSQVLLTTTNQRRIEGPLDDELPYTDYNHLPVASGYKSHAYEYGYSYIPPEKWYPLPPRPPVCVTEKRAPVCPMYSDNVADLKEFHTASRITQPYRLSQNIVHDKLNSGR